MRSETLLLVVDVQERLHPAMHEDLRASVESNLRIWAQAARALGIPVIASEQYPKGLGPTLPWLTEALGVTPMPKISFDALGDASIHQAIAATGRKTIIVAGEEAHICVWQTARAIQASGRKALVLKDAIASRTKANWEVGLELIRGSGATITSTEAALFDLLGAGGTDEFKAISKLIR